MKQNKSDESIPWGAILISAIVCVLIGVFSGYNIGAARNKTLEASKKTDETLQIEISQNSQILQERGYRDLAFDKPNSGFIISSRGFAGFYQTFTCLTPAQVEADRIEKATLAKARIEATNVVRSLFIQNEIPWKNAQ